MVVGFATPLQLTVTDWPLETLAGLAVKLAVSEAAGTVIVIEAVAGGVPGTPVALSVTV